MEISEIIKYLECWAPPGASWDKDNTGLQAGSTERKIKNILLCLELTSEAVNEAIASNCNLIISHHPLIFKPLKSLNLNTDKTSQLIAQLIQNEITLYSSHTSLDFTKGGVSFELAKILGLKDIQFLENMEGKLLKLIVFVPEKDVEIVSEAVFAAGAGIVGEYSKCSFRSNGNGTFLGSENTNPSIGKKEVFEETGEVKLEVPVHSWNLKKVLSRMIAVHPYEEPAYDIIPTQNASSNFGMGAIGKLEIEMSGDDFLKFVSEKLEIKNLRYSKGKKGKISSVAVCGGSGSDLLNSAIRKNADAFITADVKYHTFHDALDKILLIDAGHYETEINSLNALKIYIDDFIAGKDKKIEVLKFTGSTNPVKFYNN